MRAQQKPRSDQAAPEAGDLCAYFALSISGRCRELCRRNDPPVPLVQRREELPFRRRQLMPEPTLEDKREVLPIHPGINVHQIRVGDFCAAASAETPPGWTYLRQRLGDEPRRVRVAVSRPIFERSAASVFA
jgi:hypothetical protein